jgi:MFS family permease
LDQTIIATAMPTIVKELNGLSLYSWVFTVYMLASTTTMPLYGKMADWNWIFYLNIPLGVPAFIMIAAALKESKANEKRPIDWFGAITLSGAIVSVPLALVLGGEQGIAADEGWKAARIAGLFGAGAVLLALFLRIETKAKEPIIPLRLFKIRTIAFGNIAGFFISAGMFGAITYIPLYVQGVIGVSPSIAGYILMPLMLSTVVTSTASGKWMNKFSYRSILVPSLVLMAVGFFLLSRMTVDTPEFRIVLYMIIAGLGMGAVYPTLGTAAQSAVDWKSRGVATASSQFFRSMGGTIGVSVLGSLLARQMAAGLDELGSRQTAVPAEWLTQFADPQALLDSELRSTMPQEVMSGLQNVFSHSLSDVFLAVFVFAVIGLAACICIGNARLVKSS